MFPSRADAIVTQARAARLDFPFTARDSPRLRARIEGDLSSVAQVVAASDGRLRSLLLVGGYARGEGTASEGAPVNDYDIVAIRDAPTTGGSLYPDLASELTERVGLKIDLAPIWRARLPAVGRTIFWYDARASGRTIWGEDLRASIRLVRPERLQREEAVRLLFNRLAGLLVVAGRVPDPFETTLAAVKADLACAEALLLVTGAYHWSLLERRARFLRLAPEAGLDDLGDAVSRATVWKLATDAAPDRDPGAHWDEARERLLLTLHHVLARQGISLPRALRAVDVRGSILYAVGTRAWPPRAPVGRSRAAGIELVAACDGARPRPGADLRRARALLLGFGELPDDGWEGLRDFFLEVRAATRP